MSRVKRQHFVPQFYLRRFSPTNLIGKIWVLDKIVLRPMCRPIKEVASRLAFYDSYIDERLRNEGGGLEKLLSVEEGKFAEGLRELDFLIAHSSKIDFSADIKAKFIWFMYIQYIRTSKMKKLVWMMDFAEEQKIAYYNQLFINKERQGVFFDMLISKVWLVFKSRPGLPFVTSDNPVSFSFVGAKLEDIIEHMKSLENVISLDNKYLNVIFPISPNYVLSITNPETFTGGFLDGQIIDTDNEQYGRIMAAIIKDAERQILSHTSEGIVRSLPNIIDNNI